MKNVELYPFFASNRNHLHDPVWLATVLQPECRNTRRGWDGGDLNLLQNPSEFAHFLILLSLRRCRSYLEIGIHKGGTLFVVDSYLRASVKGYQRSVGVDASDNRVDWEEYRKKFKRIEFRHMHSSELDLSGEFFDAIFIDGSHIYRVVFGDYKRTVGHGRIIGFHDVDSRKRHVARVWKEVKAIHAESKAWEFVCPTPRLKWMKGIGAIELKAIEGRK